MSTGVPMVEGERLPARRSPPRRYRLDGHGGDHSALSSWPRRHRAPAWHHPWRWRYSWNSGATVGQSRACRCHLGRRRRAPPARLPPPAAQSRQAWASPSPPPQPSLLTLPPPQPLPQLPRPSATAVATATLATTAAEAARCAAPRSCPTCPPRAPTPAAVVGWRRGWGGWRLPQALAAVPAVLSGCLARRRLQLPSSRASQDLKKGCSDKSRFFVACSGPCRPDLKPRPIP